MKLFHINVVCSDFEKSYEFYVDTLGLIPLTRKTAGIGVTDGAPVPERRADGRLPGEARTRSEDGPPAARAMGLDADVSSRGVLLFWPGSPEGPYIDLLQFVEGGTPQERTPKEAGFARLAMQVEDIDAEYTRLSERGVKFVTEPTQITLGASRIKIVFFHDPDATMLELVELVGNGWGN